MMLWMLRVYSVAFLFLAVGSFQFSLPHARTVFDYIDIPVTLFALTGFIAYAFEFPIGRPKFWKYFLYVAVGWDLLYNAVLCYGLNLGQRWNPEPITPELLFANFVLFIPEYYALYLFGQMSDEDFDGDGNPEGTDFAKDTDRS
jgi:hypothetical protein